MSGVHPSPTRSQPKLLEQVRDAIRARHYSLRTEEAYVRWVKRFILFHDKRHPRDMGLQEVQQFLTHLAVEGHVAASTQSQALSALLFLYQQVLKQDIGWIEEVVRAKPPQRMPVVLTSDEVAAVLRQLAGTPWIMATLLYGAGLRLMECVRLRVKDVDFAYHQIVVRDGKGQKDRVTMLPQQVKEPLQQHIQAVQQLHEADLQAGAGHVYLPYALARKYPYAAKEWGWQYVFPARNLSVDPRSGITRRHHVDPSVINKAIKVAVRRAGLTKHISAHPFRHAFATHLLQRGTDIRTMQQLLGHNDLATTMISTHILQQGGQGIQSPLDDLGV